MKWREYGEQLLLRKSLNQPFYMLDDIIMAYLVKEDRSLTYEQIYTHLSEQSGIDLEDCKENCKAILDILIKNHNQNPCYHSP